MSTETRIRDALGTVDTDLDPEFVAQLRNRLVAERDDLADVAETEDGKRRSRRPLLVGTIAAAVALLIGLAALAAVRGDNDPVAVQATDSATNKGKAEAFAQELLDQVMLPAGSRLLSPPVAIPNVLEPASTRVTWTGTWIVPMSMNAAEGEMRTKFSPELRLAGTDVGQAHGVVNQRGISFTPVAPLDPAFAEARADVRITSSDNGANEAGVTVRTSVTYRPERPADAHIPATAKVAVIALDSPLQHTPFPNPVTLTDTRLQDIIAAIEAAPVPPDVMSHCPRDTGDRYVVRFGPSFEAAPDAVVSVGTTGCQGAVIAKDGRDISRLEGNTIVAAIEEALRGRP